jgi:hypothetical protein
MGRVDHLIILLDGPLSLLQQGPDVVEQIYSQLPVRLLFFANVCVHFPGSLLMLMAH